MSATDTPPDNASLLSQARLELDAAWMALRHAVVALPSSEMSRYLLARIETGRVWKSLDELLAMQKILRWMNVLVQRHTLGERVAVQVETTLRVVDAVLVRVQQAGRS